MWFSLTRALIVASLGLAISGATVSISAAAEPKDELSDASKSRRKAQVPACRGVNPNTLGNCIIPPNNIPRMNCPACCALRGALTWIPPAGPGISCR